MNQFPLDSIDSVMIIDSNYKIVHAMRIENSGSDINHYSQDSYIGQSLFNIYPDIQDSESSYKEASITGKPVFRFHQKYKDYLGHVCYTNNLTIPLIDRGRITGFVGLSKDVTSIQNITSDNSDEEFSFDTVKPDLKSENVEFADILTKNSEMKECIRQARKLSSLKNPVLIYGETGTGKELFAQAIMNNSGIPRHKIITQNCAAIPDNLIESMLFGTVKGSFTGSENKEGLFELAKDGILYLDELNSLPYNIQGNLLRVIQDGTYRPVGSYVEKQTNAKVIAAMNISPIEAIESKILRKDLFYRFSSSLISIPPLRKRQEDIKMYIKVFTTQKCIEEGIPIKEISKDLWNILLHYPYGGNVRELRHIVNFMINDSDSEMLDVKNLPAYMADLIDEYKTKANYEKNKTYDTNYYSHDTKSATSENISSKEPLRFSAREQIYNGHSINLEELLSNVERAAIHEAMKRCNGNISDAAAILSISRQNLNYKLKKYNIDRHNYTIR